MTTSHHQSTQGVNRPSLVASWSASSRRAELRVDLSDVEHCHLDVPDEDDFALLNDGAFRAPDWWQTAPGAHEEWPMLDALVHHADNLDGAARAELPQYFPADADRVDTFLKWLEATGIAHVQVKPVSYECVVLQVRLRFTAEPVDTAALSAA
jgi:hypothetical protein